MKQNLDKYFKQKLDVPQQPPKDAWEFIQNQIPKQQEKKRFVPFWMRLSGIAAVLLLMVGLGYWLGTMNNPVVQSTPQLVIHPNGNSNNSGLNSHVNSNNPEIQNSGNSSHEIPNYISSESERNMYESNSNLNSTAVYSENRIYSQNQNSQFIHSSNSNFDSESNFNAFVNPNQNSIQTLNNSSENPYLAFNNFSNPKLDLNPLPTINDAQLNQNKNPELLLVLDDHPKKETKKKKRTDFDRFYVSGFVSPLAFNSFVGNSMLADEMSQYSTENSVTLAYGVKAAYSLTPNLKIRTGVSMVGLEQITKNVPLEVQVAGAASLASVDKINNINYGGNVRIDNNPAAVSVLGTELIQQKSGFGNMQQQTSYVEIPLEAELSLLQTNSIGISATGGASTWVLSKNKIYVHTEDYTEELGKANNLNDVTFSANAGLKFDMKLTDNVKLNVEPNFRYLVNPVNNIEKYNPYTVGVNAGVSVSLK